MKHIKKTSIWATVILIVGIFITSQAFAGEIKTQEKAASGVKMEPKSGVRPEVHQKAEFEKGYHRAMIKRHQGINALSASELIGKPVISADGQPAGKLKDIIIFQGGRVHYGILSMGTMGAEKLVPVPFESLQIIKGSEQLTLNLDAEMIENAPTLSKEELNTCWNSDKGKEVHSYFGMNDYMTPMKKKE